MKSILFTQLLYVISNLIFCLGGFMLCVAIGIPCDYSLLICLIGSLLVGDVVGFLVLITPGGLGVRESMMFFIISGIATRNVAIVVPIATRLLTMSVDISLGITAFFLGQKTVFGRNFGFKSTRKI